MHRNIKRLIILFYVKNIRIFLGFVWNVNAVEAFLLHKTHTIACGLTAALSKS